MSAASHRYVMQVFLDEKLGGTYQKGRWLQQLVQTSVKVGILQPILGDQHKDGMQSKHAQKASCIKRPSHEISQQMGVAHVGYHLLMKLHQSLHITATL